MSHSSSREMVLTSLEPHDCNSAHLQTAGRHNGTLPEELPGTRPIHLQEQERIRAKQIAQDGKGSVYQLQEDETIDLPPSREKMLCVVLEGVALYDNQYLIGLDECYNSLIIFPYSNPVRWRAYCNDTMIYCFNGEDIQKVCNRPLMRR